MTQGDAARLYHRLTSYSPDREWDDPADDPRVRHDLVPNDPATLPPPVKRYTAELPVTPLPRDPAPTTYTATEVLAGAVPAPAAAPDLAALARLLYLSAGVVRVAERDGRRMLFRASGSAGNRFPLEVYLAARGIDGLADGVHWYDPQAHALRQVGPAPAGDVSTIVVTGVPWRTGWRYAERGYRHLYWDAGTLLAQQSALAASAGLPALLRTVFPDRQVAELVGADGVHEFPLALLTLGAGDPAIVPGGPAATGEVDTDPPEFGLITAAQRAGDGEVLGDPWPSDAPLAGDHRRPRRSTRSSSAGGRPAGWTAPPPWRRPCSTGRSPPRPAASRTGSTSPSTASRASNRACTPGPTWRPRSRRATCEPKCGGSASTRASAATRPTS
jgi:hypothetical protein